MSIVSRARHAKQPTPVSGRPRQFNKRPKSEPFDLTNFQKVAHESNVYLPKVRGAFGGVTISARKARLERERADLLSISPSK